MEHKEFFILDKEIKHDINVTIITNFMAKEHLDRNKLLLNKCYIYIVLDDLRVQQWIISVPLNYLVDRPSLKISSEGDSEVYLNPPTIKIP